MVTSTQEQIVAYLLSHPEEQLTIRGIAQRLKKSYTLVYNNLAGLEKDKIILKRSVPPAQIISLHEYAPLDILTSIELKRKREFLGKYPWVHVMLNDFMSSAHTPFFILLVFGSYAKSKQ